MDIEQAKAIKEKVEELERLQVKVLNRIDQAPVSKSGSLLKISLEGLPEPMKFRLKTVLADWWESEAALLNETNNTRIAEITAELNAL